MRLKILALAGACLFFSPRLVSSQALAGSDLDGDGFSDITLIDIQDDSSLAWSAYSAAGSPVTGSSVTIGQAGYHISLANWASASKAQRGYVSVEGEKVVWTVVPESGSAVSRTLGGAKDTLLSGADFNGNGFADGAYIRKPLEGETIYNWRIRNDFFRDLGGGRAGKRTVKKFRFGSVGDTAFFVDARGKGDWLAVLGVNPTGAGSLIKMMNPANGKVRRFRVPSFTKGTLRPLALRQAQGADILALARREGGNTPVKFVNMRGQVVSEATLPGEGELIVGNFLAASGQELAIQQDDGSFLIHNPRSGEQSSVGLPSGIAIDDININSFDPEPEEPTCEDETLSPYDGSDRFLWKPKGENSGLLRVLWPQIWTGKIVEVIMIDPEGEFIERADISYDATNPNARTFALFRYPGGHYPPNLTVRARLRAGCYKSYVIPTPSKRVD